MYPSLEKVAVFIGSVIMAIFLLELFLQWKRRPFLRSLSSIPTMQCFPIIGHAGYCFGAYEKLLHKIANYYLAFRESNIKVWALHRVYIFITKIEDIALTVKSPDFTNKSTDYTILQNSIMGQGLFSTTDLSKWRQNRKLINPAFKLPVLKCFINNFYVEAKILADKLIEIMERDGEVEVFEPTGLCTMDMVMQNTMGVSVDAQKNSDHVFIRGLDTVMKVWHERILRPWYLPKFLFDLSPLKSVHDTAMHEIQSFATEIILIKLEKRLHKLKTTGTNNNNQIMGDGKDDNDCGLREPKVFLDLLIECIYDGVDEHVLTRTVEKLRKVSNHRGNQNNNGNNQHDRCQIKTGENANCDPKSMKNNIEKLKSVIEYFVRNFRKVTVSPENEGSVKSCAEGNDIEMDEATEVRLQIGELQQLNRQLRDEMITIMIGGQETTANENSFAVLMLAMHQEPQKKVEMELNEIFGHDLRAPDIEDLQRMKYLECVIKETMRLYPALPVIARVAEKDTVLTDNTLVVKGSSVGYFVYGIHRDDHFFPDPNRFLPERFLPENSVDRHPYSFLPFFGGTRNCIGNKYAMFQMKTILSTLVRKFKIMPSERMPTINHIRLQLSTTLRPAGGCWVKLERRLSQTNTS